MQSIGAYIGNEGRIFKMEIKGERKTEQNVKMNRNR